MPGLGSLRPHRLVLLEQGQRSAGKGCLHPVLALVPPELLALAYRQRHLLRSLAQGLGFVLVQVQAGGQPPCP